ncbi:MAG: APC family permease [Solirubrobacterales bacterium]|nr:APC family permease [Solirubrobacterales bacterium]
MRNVAEPISVAGPTAGTAILAATMAGVTGTPGATGFLLGMVAGALLVYVFSLLTRHFESAGGAYYLMGVLAGTRVAIVVGLVYVAAYLAGSGAVVINAASYVGPALGYLHGPDIAWGPAAIVVWAIVLLLTVRHVKKFTSALVVIELLGFTALLTVGIVILVQGANDGKAILQAFSLKGIGLSQLFLGVVVAFSAFGGFEAGLMLSEETKNNRHVVPRGMWLALIVAGLIYTFGSWFQYVGFGSVTALAGSPAPLFVLAQRTLGSGVAFVMTVLVIIAAVAAASGNLSGGGRVMFAMVRDGMGRASLAQVNPRTRAPARIMMIGAAITLIAWVPLALSGQAANNAFTYVVTTGSLFLTVSYFAVALTGTIWFARLRDWTSAAISLLAMAIVGYALYSSLYPVPSAPIRYLPWGVAGYVIALTVMVFAARGLVRRVASSPFWSEGRAIRRSLLLDRRHVGPGAEVTAQPGA